ncbi:Lipopolysaccharide assembly protein B [anaerobic digester metagenome]
MDSSDGFFSEEELDALVTRFRDTVEQDANDYFEADELEAIADALLKRDDLVLAKSAIKYGYTMYPDNEDFEILDIHYHVLDNRSDSAEQLAKSFIDRHPDNVEVRLVLASILSDRGNHRDALDLLEQARELDPESEHAITSLSMEYQVLGQHRKAIDLYREILDRNPEDEFALNELVFVYEVANEITEAIRFLTDFTDQYPFNQQAWFHLANTCNINNEPMKAIDAYDYALAIDPAFTPAMFGKGHSYMFAGDHLKAIDCFRETAESEGFKAASYLSLGEAYSQMNNYGVAAEYYQKSIEADSTYNESRMGLAYCLYMMNLDEEALRHVNEAILNEPERSDTYQLKGTVLMNLERYSEAATEFRNAIRADKENEAAWLDLSETHHFLTGIPEALNILHEAEEVLEAENAMIAYRKAALFFEAGKDQEAVSQLLTGLSINAELYTSIYSYNKELENNEIIQEIVTMFLNQ